MAKKKQRSADGYREILDEMVKRGEATVIPRTHFGPLPVIRLTKPVHDLPRIIREAKGS